VFLLCDYSKYVTDGVICHRNYDRMCCCAQILSDLISCPTLAASNYTTIIFTVRIFCVQCTQFVSDNVLSNIAARGKWCAAASGRCASPPHAHASRHSAPQYTPLLVFFGAMLQNTSHIFSKRPAAKNTREPSRDTSINLSLVLIF